METILGGYIHLLSMHINLLKSLTKKESLEVECLNAASLSSFYLQVCNLDRNSILVSWQPFSDVNVSLHPDKRPKSYIQKFLVRNFPNLFMSLSHNFSEDLI